MKNKIPAVWRPFLYLIIINIAFLALSNLYFYRTFANFYLEQSVKELAVSAKLFNREIVEIRGIPLVRGNKALIDNYAREVGKITESRVTIMNDLGELIGDTLELPENPVNDSLRKEFNVKREGEIMTDIRVSTVTKETMLFVAVPLYINGEYRGAGRAARNIKDIEHMRGDIISDIIFFNIAILLVLSTISYFISRLYTKQLRYIKSKAQKLALGDFETRLKPPKVEEFRILADSFNFMAEAMQIRMQTILNQRNDLKVILNSINDALIAVDYNGTVTDINHAAAALLGINIDKAKGRNVHEIIKPRELLDFINETVASNIFQERDIPFTDQVEQDHVWHVKCGPLSGSRENSGGCVVTFHDITQQWLTAKMRRDFVSNVSHEIRTPLSVIQGSAEALTFSGLVKGHEEQEFLDNIVSYSIRLGNLLNDILLLSRIEQNQQELETELCAIRPIILSAVNLVKSKNETVSPQIHAVCSKTLKATVNYSLLEQALINLIDNAVKYSGSDKIEIGAEIIGRNCYITVMDEGLGIPPEHIERLTERFYRIDKARARQTGGSGLGLAIVKHIAKAHKGRLKIKSVLNEGSAFTIIIPV